MARRNQSSDDEGVNLDSLMDALTNVVAVLILVLVLVQADVVQKVSDFLDDLEPATPEQIVESKMVLDKNIVEKKKLEELLKDEAPSPAEIEKEKTKLAILEENAKERKDLLADLEELKKLEKKAREEKDIEEKKTTTLQERIAKLEAQLDDTPVLKAAPSTVVSIPNSRPIPNNAKIYYAIVHEDRVHFIDPFTPEEQFLDAAKKNRKDWVLRRVKQKGADKYIYDQTKIVAYFQNKPLSNSRAQNILIPGHPTGKSLYIDIMPDLKNGGTTIDELSQKQSLFSGIMRKLSGDRKAVVMFKVHPNGFNTYLVARQVADDSKVASGWEVSGRDRHRFHVHEIEVQRLKERSPPKPPVGPPAPKPPKIDPKLD